MRLKTPMASANERLIALINRGWAVLEAIQADYGEKKAAARYDKNVDMAQYGEQLDKWATDVAEALETISPPELERNLFLNPDIPSGAVSGDYEYQVLLKRSRHFVRGLDAIRHTSLPQYTDLPQQDRLYVEDIDGFQKVRDVNPAMVS